MRLSGVYLSWGVLQYAEVQATCAQVGWVVVLASVATCSALSSPLQGTAAAVACVCSIVCAFAAMYHVQRRIASGLPFAYASSFEVYRTSPAACNVRNNSPWAQLCRDGDGAAGQARPVAVVTGGNAGIGWWNAVELSLLGFDVLLCCRSRQRAEEAISHILAVVNEMKSKNSSTHRAGVVVFVPLDLECEASIRAAAAAVALKAPHVALLINNAGMFSPQVLQTCSYGDEKLVGVNFSGVVLFTELILQSALEHCDRVKRRHSEVPSLRIVNVASIAHLWAKLPDGMDVLETLNACLAASGPQRGGAPVVPAHGVPCNTYGFSKLLLIMYSRALARRLQPTFGRVHRISVVSVHPGAVLTDIFRELGVVAKIMPWVLRTIFKTPAEGAETTLFAALSDAVVSGSYYADCRCADSSLSPLATNDKRNELVLQRVLKRWSLPAA